MVNKSYKVLIALQGPINEKTYKCAETFLDLNYDLVMIGWQGVNLANFEQSKIKIDLIKDPKTLVAKDGLKDINTRRQILTNKYLLDNYQTDYDYIIRLRNDIKLVNKKFFLKQFSIAQKKNKLWSINVNTSAPRILSPFLLSHHISDWFFAGTPKQLRKNLQLNDINESEIVKNKPCEFKNFYFSRKVQNEQAIWKRPWRQLKSQNKFQLLYKKPWIKNNFKICKEYAIFLNKNFFISAFRKTGIESIKYKFNLKKWYFNPYNLFILNSFEIFLLNRGLIVLNILYPPILRIFFFKLRLFFQKKLKLRY